MLKGKTSLRKTFFAYVLMLARKSTWIDCAVALALAVAGFMSTVSAICGAYSAAVAVKLDTLQGYVDPESGLTHKQTPRTEVIISHCKHLIQRRTSIRVLPVPAKKKVHVNINIKSAPC